MHRFFVSPQAFTSQLVTLRDDQAHQIRRVLRMRLGERAVLLDNRGWEYEAILVAMDERTVRFQAIQRQVATGEPRTEITLYQAVLKGDRFVWALQKGTEVGISRFVPVICERNVVDDFEAVERKRARWERVIREAAEQSRRARLPGLEPTQLFRHAVESRGIESAEDPTGEGAKADDPDSPATSPLRLIPWEEEADVQLRSALAGCNFAQGARIELFVGPEGGFTRDEIEMARRYGIQPVTLGPRILRAETAGVVAATAILYEAGDI